MVGKHYTDLEPNIQREPEPLKAPEELLQAQALANLLDTSVRIPGIGIKLGLDFLVGLIPVVGDALMLLASLRIIQLAHRMGVPLSLKKKMLLNSVMDMCLGFVPIFGDIVDIFFKANQRNVRIVEQWWVSENKEQLEAMQAQLVEQWEQKQASNQNSLESQENVRDIDA